MKNQLLKINLSDRKYSIEEIPDTIIQRYIGGRGLGAYYLYQLVQPKIDPLGEKNHLIFSTGLAGNTSLPYSSKAVVTTKSPLTGIYLFSISSGTLSHQMRRAGFLAIDIYGSSESPVYITITDQKVEFKKANHLRGVESNEAQNRMLDELKARDAATMSIGSAGEKLIRYANVMTDGKFYRTFGRGGVGCVMGSKNLKGVVVSGSSDIAIPDTEKFEKVKKDIFEKVKKQKVWADKWRKFGTRQDITTLSYLGMLPTRNWQNGVFESAEKICFDTLDKEWHWKNRPCGPYCPTPCSEFIEIEQGQYKGAHCDGPEYETLYALGSNCGIDRLDALIKADQICDENGLDTMSAGICISFAMECFEKGLIGLKDTDGLELRFGNHEAMIAALEKIVKLEGFGLLLAKGVRKLSAEIKGSEAFAMHVKGLELGGYECRGLNGQALQFAINNRGGCHHGYGLPARVEAFNNTRLEIKGKGEMVKNAAIHQVMLDSLLTCSFARPVMSSNEDILSSLMGKDWATNSTKEAGMRIICQERMFNMREGISRKDDTLPARLTKEPKPDGPTKGVVVPLEELKDDFYKAMEWDLQSGNPSDTLISNLGIEK